MDILSKLMISPYRAYANSGNGLVWILNANGDVITEVQPGQLPARQNYIPDQNDRYAVARFMADALNRAAGLPAETCAEITRRSDVACQGETSVLQSD